MSTVGASADVCIVITMKRHLTLCLPGQVGWFVPRSVPHSVWSTNQCWSADSWLLIRDEVSTEIGISV